MSEGTTETHVEDASASASSHVAQQDGGELINFLRPASAGLAARYSEVARPSRPDNVLPVAYVPDQENELPNRPLTAFFTPRYRVPANEVFEALKEAGVESSDISCVQRQSSGEIVLTFRSAQFKENFLQKNVIKLRDQPFAVQDVDRPLTYLQVFDAPHEMPDPTIVNRLSKYCDVLSSRRGYFREPGWENVQDGVRHYRVRIKSPIPNYMRFGKILVHFRYEGQPRTCRHCHQTGHYANACHTVICYNCEQTGHLASECPERLLCNLCKSPDHKARSCPFSWTRETVIVNAELSANNNNNLSPEENTAPDENSPPEDITPPPSGDPLFTGPDPPSQVDDDDFQSISDETDSEADLTLDSSETPPPAPPVKPSLSSRKPAKLPDTIIPQRRATQPTLVTGKPAATDETPFLDVHMSDENDVVLKRKTAERSRTNKHKKRK